MENNQNDKSVEFKEDVLNDSKDINRDILRLHKEAIKIERERTIKYVLNHFLDIGILDSDEFERYFNIFNHDLESI